MKKLMLLISALLILAGFSIVIRPAIFYDWVEGSLAMKSFYYSVIIGRFAFGLLLVLAASYSKHPIFIKLFGGLAILTAVAFVLMGHDYFVQFMSIVMLQLRPYALVSGLVSVVMGGFFMYTFLER